MAKKASKKIVWVAPVTLALALVPPLMAVVEPLVGNGTLAALFRCPGASFSAAPFQFARAGDYAAILLHVCGSGGSLTHALGTALCVLLAGTAAEERYGSPFLVLLVALSALVSGVLSACFNPLTLSGMAPAVFLLLMLDMAGFLPKKGVPAPLAAACAAYTGWELASVAQSSGAPVWQAAVPVLLSLCGAAAAATVALQAAAPATGTKAKARTGSKKGATAAPKRAAPKRKAPHVPEEPTLPTDDEFTVISPSELDDF